jgi:plastocyanin
MRIFRVAVPAALALAGVTCSQQPVSSPTTLQGVVATPGSAAAESTGGPIRALANTPLTATVQFGQPNVGSPFPPPSGHDASGHAKDNLVPRTVVIKTGGTVTFNTFEVHQVAIYDAGTEPEDINTSIVRGTPCLGNAPLLINDATDRLAVFDQPCAGGPASPSYTFTEPGRYLVICSFLPHFELQMWGWVIVKD